MPFCWCVTFDVTKVTDNGVSKHRKCYGGYFFVISVTSVSFQTFKPEFVGTVQRLTKTVLISFILFLSSLNEVCFKAISEVK